MMAEIAPPGRARSGASTNRSRKHIGVDSLAIDLSEGLPFLPHRQAVRADFMPRISSCTVLWGK